MLHYQSSLRRAGRKGGGGREDLELSNHYCAIYTHTYISLSLSLYIYIYIYICIYIYIYFYIFLSLSLYLSLSILSRTIKSLLCYYGRLLQSIAIILLWNITREYYYIYYRILLYNITIIYYRILLQSITIYTIEYYYRI